jgi:O-antigen/teichoic acid export membrane protein
MGSVVLQVLECGFNQYLVPRLTDQKHAEGAELVKVTALKALLFPPALLAALGFMLWRGYEGGLMGVVSLILLGTGLDALGSPLFVLLQVRGRQAVEGRIKTWSAIGGFGYGALALFAGAPPPVIACFRIVESALGLLGAAAATLPGLTLRRGRPRPADLWRVARQGAVYTGMALATTVYNKANLFFLHAHAGSEGVALYSAAWELVDGTAGIAVSLLLGNVLFPVFVALWPRDAGALRRMARQTAAWLLALSLPAAFLLAVESDRIMTLLYGARFEPAIGLQRLLSAALPIAMLHNLAAYLMISMRRQGLLLAIYLGGLALNLLLCPLLIPPWPLGGAAAAILVTKGAVAAATLWFCQRRLGLLRLRLVAPLGLALLLGALLHQGGGMILRRGFAELLAILPMGLLAWHWRRSAMGAMQR